MQCGILSQSTCPRALGLWPRACCWSHGSLQGLISRTPSPPTTNSVLSSPKNLGRQLPPKPSLSPNGRPNFWALRNNTLPTEGQAPLPPCSGRTQHPPRPSPRSRPRAQPPAPPQPNYFWKGRLLLTESQRQPHVLAVAGIQKPKTLVPLPSLGLLGLELPAHLSKHLPPHSLPFTTLPYPRPLEAHFPPPATTSPPLCTQQNSSPFNPVQWHLYCEALPDL